MAMQRKEVFLLVKTYMTNCCLLDVVEDLHSAQDSLASVLYGIVTEDTTARFPIGFQVITSPVVKRVGNKFYTKKGSVYCSDTECKTLVVSLSEWHLMRIKTLSPADILSYRTNIAH